VRPLLDADLLDAVDGSTQLWPGLELMLVPGHTPGHQCVVVDLGAETLLVTGDAFLHPGQLADPDLRYVYDSDHFAAAEARRRLLNRSASKPTVLAPAHFPATLLSLELSSSGIREFTTLQGCPRGGDGTQSGSTPMIADGAI
jgi:glyoxylase-like metal-dependent hydrolase (beta-lactamase superfamily II)